MKKVLIIQHEESTPPGSTIKWIEERNYDYEIYFFANSLIEPQIDFDLFIICGGGMNVDEEALFPWLIREKKFIKKLIELEKPIIGLCLGAQLLAELLGGKVFKAEHYELGWFDVELLEENNSSRKFLHWHAQQFISPPGSIVIAKNKACPHQAFRWHNHILAFQFHPEGDETWVRNNAAKAKFPPADQYAQTPEEVVQGLTHQKPMETWYFKTLDNFVKNSLNR